ncbi:hypothetical protein [Formosa sp. Hel1_33_131]|uniref:hypothetical protein n=1 Tax=Formosa sp. Hel1_33_131 TaxID=1336794 RepID=UPI00084E1FE8|nr:hypothetical protein [Formosa sp. Hel1_33_131]
MSIITYINNRIDELKHQMSLTDQDKNISSKDKKGLNDYYRTKLNRYVNIQKKLTKTIEVKAEILNPD